MKGAVNRIRIKDVAEYTGVSIATVSKVLNGKDQHISSATISRINEAIKELGYVPNDFARRLKEKNSKTIGLVLPDISNAFTEMAEGAEEEATRNGYSILFSSTNYNAVQEERALKMMISKMVDGIIYVSSEYSELEKIITKSKIPYATIDRENKGDGSYGMVKINNYQAMKDVAKLLASNNCTKIGYISADISRTPSKQRYKGLRDGLEEFGIQFQKKLLYEGTFCVETGYIGAMTLLDRDKEIDAIICGNDLIAMGAMNALQKSGVDIPGQIKVVGFDDIYLAKYLNPELTTVRQNAHDMGRIAAKMLIQHVEKGDPLDVITLKHEIIQRGST